MHDDNWARGSDTRPAGRPQRAMVALRGCVSVPHAIRLPPPRWRLGSRIIAGSCASKIARTLGLATPNRSEIVDMEAPSL